jgi:aminomethyltransferase
MDEERYMLVVNAANRGKDAAWISSRLEGAASFEDISDTLAQIALQGPAAPVILSGLSATIPGKYYTLIEKGNVAGVNCIVSQTGYTGEAGYEIYCGAGDAEGLWEKLMDAGREAGLIPCGLGARDTLRLEAAMPLYGHEMNETVTPFEAGLAFSVKMKKDDFIGKAALTGKEKSERIRAGVRITGRGIAREDSEIFYQGRSVGRTTSGTFCPYLKEALAMALVDSRIAAAGTPVEVEVRGRRLEAEICALPFYKK